MKKPYDPPCAHCKGDIDRMNGKHVLVSIDPMRQPKGITARVTGHWEVCSLTCAWRLLKQVGEDKG